MLLTVQQGTPSDNYSSMSIISGELGRSNDIPAVSGDASRIGCRPAGFLLGPPCRSTVKEQWEKKIFPENKHEKKG